MDDDDVELRNLFTNNKRMEANEWLEDRDWKNTELTAGKDNELKSIRAKKIDRQIPFSFIHSFIHSGDLYSAFLRHYYSHQQETIAVTNAHRPNSLFPTMLARGGSRCDTLPT